uniref:HMG box domain-containing protein n=1 Tax=Panagrellus redivivus TaxID=6233 RepID=A0A7E4UUF2_PANRE
MADWTLPLTHFCAENYPLMKQLKPFRFYDDASQNKILESAWTKLNEKNRQHYVNTVEYPLSNGNARYRDMREADSSKDGKDDAFEIYRTEMRLILLQDPAFVKDHYHELETVIQEGWKGLSDEQRLDFYERVVLATEYGKQQPDAVQSLPVKRESQHSVHEDTLLTNESDNYAFYAYVRDEDCLLDTNTLWKQWKNLSDSTRELIYCSGYYASALNQAERLFIEEKEIIKPNENNKLEYAAEQEQLRQAWNDLGDTIKHSYVMQTFDDIAQRDRDQKTRFIGKYNYNLDSLLASATPHTDANSHLEILHPFALISDDSEQSAFILYMEKMRPDMLKEPGMAQKRYWEVNLILRDQWNALSKEDQQYYYTTVRRYLEMQKNMSGWKLEAKEVYGQGDDGFQKLDAETKKKYEDIALQNRKVLLKMYPDLHEYALWTPNKNNKTDSKASSETKKVDAVKSDVENITQKSDKPPKVYQYCDSLDKIAFDTYRSTVQTMTSHFMGYEVFWPAFLNLSDEERDVYYDAAIKSESLKKARTLFAKDYGYPVRKLNQDGTFIQELTKMHCTWENLSTPAKQYYINIASENLLENQRKKVFDALYTDESHYEFENEYGSLWGTLKPKCVYYGSLDQEKAVMLYLKHHEEELLKEPGMANKRQFQLAMIMEQRFKNLSDEERQPYYDIVNRVKEICDHLNVFHVEGYKIYSKNFGSSQKWKYGSDDEKTVCEQVKKQNMATLLRKFPDVGSYFHWIVYDNKGDKSRSDNTITFVQKEGMVQNKPIEQTQKADATTVETSLPKETTVTNKTTEQASPGAECSGTSEVAINATTIQNEETTSTKDAESTTAVISDGVSQDNSLKRTVETTVTDDTSKESKPEGTHEVVKDEKVVQEEQESETNVPTSEEDESVTLETITTESVKAENETAEASDIATDAQILVDISEPTINAKTEKQIVSESSTTVAINDKKNTQEDASVKSAEVINVAVPDNESESCGNSTQDKKTPTAFMFYKKAMRRLNADQNFGKKGNVLERQALISDWKKLSDEDKAVYYEKERLARLQLEKQ